METNIKFLKFRWKYQELRLKKVFTYDLFAFIKIQLQYISLCVPYSDLICAYIMK